MKRILIISSVVVLILALLGGAWWYLLINGRPEGLSELPNPFGIFGGSNDSDDFTPTAPTVDTDGPRLPPSSLRKITPGPVAGATFILREGKSYIRYVERGTGHIFEVGPESGTPSRISGTTIPRTTRAVLSPFGSRVVLITETEGSAKRVFVGTIERSDQGEETLTTDEIEESAGNFAFASSTGEMLYYTVPTATGSVGCAHNLQTNARTIRFTTPLRDIVVTWEPALVAYTTPTARQFGYAYEGSGFSRLFGGLRGLMLLSKQNYRIISYASGQSLTSYVDSLIGDPLAVPVFPEKCASSMTETMVLWCGAALAVPPASYPDSWYQGIVSFDDSLWKINIESGSATLLSTPEDDAGEAIDVTDMHASDSGDILIFINKKDGALWLQKTNER